MSSVASVGAINTSNLKTYAEKYVTNPNNSYVYFENGDCTNFVSQCLGDSKAGGISQAKNLSLAQKAILLVKDSIADSDSWFYDKDDDKYSESWTRATKLADYLKAYKGCTAYYWNNTEEKSIESNIASIYYWTNPGDVIQLGRNMNDVYHSLVVISKDPEYGLGWNRNGYTVKITYAQHTSNKTGTIEKKVDKDGNVSYTYPIGWGSYGYIRNLKMSEK